MNALLRCAAVALSIAGLSACTSTHEVVKSEARPQQAAPAQAQAQAQAQGDYKPVDALYVARVEHAARTRGVEVKWVNPPRKRQDVARR